ncbi:MAG: cytochrome c1 [Gammaproteobacteria bacterium]|nr:cytochrome c1 [Gammaproteobacteria bacterium]
MKRRKSIGSARALSAVVVAATLMVSSVLYAAGGGGADLESPRIDTSNQKSLQRGAQTFVNYCMGCHSAGYHRYNRLAADLGLSEADVVENLILTTDESGERTKVGALMTNNMTEDYGKQAFGVVPPNLTLTARSRGVDWIYSYMKSFYLDPERAGVGVNNTVYPGAAMPHVLWEQQGWQKAVYKEVERDGEMHKEFDKFEQLTPGTHTTDEYDQLITDLTNFLAYVADPGKHQRHRIGMYVMIFLLFLTGIAYLLKQEYWKDIEH